MVRRYLGFGQISIVSESKTQIRLSVLGPRSTNGEVNRTLLFNCGNDQASNNVSAQPHNPKQSEALWPKATAMKILKPILCTRMGKSTNKCEILSKEADGILGTGELLAKIGQRKR